MGCVLPMYVTGIYWGSKRLEEEGVATCFLGLDSQCEFDAQVGLVKKARARSGPRYDEKEDVADGMSLTANELGSWASDGARHGCSRMRSESNTFCFPWCKSSQMSLREHRGAQQAGQSISPWRYSMTCPFLFFLGFYPSGFVRSLMVRLPSSLLHLAAVLSGLSLTNLRRWLTIVRRPCRDSVLFLIFFRLISPLLPTGLP